jgi:hypothetical protein
MRNSSPLIGEIVEVLTCAERATILHSAELYLLSNFFFAAKKTSAGATGARMNVTKRFTSATHF